MDGKREDSYFPLFVSLEGKRVFIAGAGKVAERRAKVLLSFGAEVSAAAPECRGEMVGVHFFRREFLESDVIGMDFVLAATDDAALNHRIAKLCKEKNIPVNNASCQDDCDFFFPAIVREDGLTIGVSSGGGDHKKVARVSKRLRSFLGKGSCLG